MTETKPLCDPRCRFYIESKETLEGRQAFCHAPTAGDLPDFITFVPFIVEYPQNKFDLDYSIFEFIACLHPEDKELRSIDDLPTMPGQAGA